MLYLDNYHFEFKFCKQMISGRSIWRRDITAEKEHRIEQMVNAKIKHFTKYWVYYSMKIQKNIFQCKSYKICSVCKMVQTLHFVHLVSKCILFTLEAKLKGSNVLLFSLSFIITHICEFYKMCPFIIMQVEKYLYLKRGG